MSVDLFNVEEFFLSKMGAEKLSNDAEHVNLI